MNSPTNTTRKSKLDDMMQIGDIFNAPISIKQTHKMHSGTSAVSRFGEESESTDSGSEYQHASQKMSPAMLFRF